MQGTTVETVGTLVWIVHLQPRQNDALPQLQRLYGISRVTSVIIRVSGNPRLQMPPRDSLANTETKIRPIDILTVA